MNQPPILGLFHKRFEGDDALLRLAQLRFRQSGLGAEPYAATPDELEHIFGFLPGAGAPVVVHLPRQVNLLDHGWRELVLAFARRFAGRIHGMVVHDQSEMATRTQDYRLAVRGLDEALGDIRNAPLLFIEYAEGLEPGRFVEFHESIGDTSHVSACIDVGHIGIRQVRAAFATRHGGLDPCSLKDRPAELASMLESLQAVVRGVLPNVEGVIRAIGAIGKPVHFHLHDGHPLSTFSPFGVSDHLGFLTEIPVASEHEGRSAVPAMFGLCGLQRVMNAACSSASPDKLSFTVEIHPMGGSLPLRDAAAMFQSWKDKANAERANHWLEILSQNAVLVRASLQNALDAKSRR